MEELIKSIKKAAAEAGACRLVAAASDLKSLAGVFFSPQGKEFCESHAFPPLPLWRRMPQYDLAALGIFVDCGEMTLRGCENAAVVGDTEATIYCQGVDFKHTVVAMHGAKAKVVARDYAVVEIINIGACVERDADQTSTLL